MSGTIDRSYWTIGRAARWLVLLLIASPFLFVTVPPLTDVPGHMGRAAIAALDQDARFQTLFRFHWFAVPNLGADLIVEGLRHIVSITRAYWLVAAAIPILLAAGLFAVARALTRPGAAMMGWALVFVWCFPFNYGFLNYMLSVALSLLGFALWMRLDARPGRREALTWLGVPLVFLCHAVGGSMLSLFIASREFSQIERHEGGQWLAFLRRIRPLIAGVAIIIVWRLSTQSVAGVNEIGVRQKLNAVVMMLRDQNIWLDIGSLGGALAVFLIGRWHGARVNRALVPAILFLLALFVVMPSRLSGSHFADMRLLPVIPMMAFVGHDWTRVDPRLTRRMAIAGYALFALRLAVTMLGFIAYGRDYRAQLIALDHISPYSRVIALSESPCDATRHWRNDRRGHLGELAQVYQRSWSNGQWDTDGGHLTQIAWRPSSAFYHDPSQHFWPDACIRSGVPDRTSFGQSMAALPYGRFDFLWLIGPHPALPDQSRLTPVWSGPDGSILYRAMPNVTSATPAPSIQPAKTSLGQ
ncbi:hypothetical protein SPAN111604_03090 [Sphingomonas antarctica]